MIRLGDPEVGRTIGESSGGGFNPLTDIAISRHRDGKLLGGAVVTAYTGSSVVIHTAGYEGAWMNRALLWAIFGYVFLQLKCKVAFGLIDSSNKPAIEFATRIGLKEVARFADMYPHGDGVFLQMTKDECKWIRLKPPDQSLFEENVHGSVQV